MIILFGLSRVLKYKRGSAAARLAALADYQTHLARWLDVRGWLSTGAAAFLAYPLAALRGAARKHYEDQIDALFCACIALHCWQTGRYTVYDGADGGTIVVPMA
jgi:predicted RNase H-like nuclease